MRTAPARRKTVGSKIQHYEPPAAPPAPQDNLVAIDVSNESSVSPMSMFRSGGSFNFQIKSHLGETIKVTGITTPSGDAVTNSFPFNIDSTPVTVNCTGYSSGNFTIAHNGLNSPFIVDITLGS